MNNQTRKQLGFTLPEVILIVSALAIVSAMAMPDIAFFMGRQTIEQEKLTLGNVQKALDSYARECRKLPTRTNNPPRSDCNSNSGGNLEWYKALSAFSNMSAGGIQNDAWGNERHYTHGTNDRTYREGNVTFHYATVRSVGPDMINDADTTPTNQTPTRVDGNWTNAADPDWEISGNNLSEYENYSPNDDDLMVKYTDSQWKVDAQDESVARIKRIIDALNRYAQARFNEEVHADGDCISEKLFYPPSHLSVDSNASHENPQHPNTACRNLNTALDQRYGLAVLQDVQTITGSAWLNTETTDDDAREDAMKALMRVLGLPEDHCCSPITGHPFYYYSNPPGKDPLGNAIYATMPPYFPPQVRVDPL